MRYVVTIHLQNNLTLTSTVEAGEELEAVLKAIQGIPNDWYPTMRPTRIDIAKD